MKKFLKLLTISTLSAPVSLSAIACSNQPNWNGIPVPPPQVPIDVTGFKGVDFQSMNIKDYDTVDSLFKALNQRFAASSWKDKSATTWTGTKDDQVIDVNRDDASNLKRNGTYKFDIKSNLDLPGDVKIIMQVTSSLDIADNMKVTNLGIIDDKLPKTILIACVFKNMNLVSKINEIADEYLDHIDIKTDGEPAPDKIVKGTATLTSPKLNSDNSQPYFSGTVTVNFSVKLKKPTQPPVDLKTVITTPNLGTIPDNRYYTILMYVIIKNFVTKLDSLAEIVNNLDIKDNDTGHSATLIAVVPSDYYKGSIPLTFTIQK